MTYIKMGAGGFVLHCSECEGFKIMPGGYRLEDLTALIDKFEKEHAKCRKVRPEDA